MQLTHVTWRKGDPNDPDTRIDLTWLQRWLARIMFIDKLLATHA